MENLSADIFCLILGYLRMDESSALPVCSRGCQELWLQYARTEVRRRSGQFVHPFLFEEGSSVTSKYYAIFEALEKFWEAHRSLWQKCREPLKDDSDGSQALELVRETRGLMSRNYTRVSEMSAIDVCTFALWRATGSYDLTMIDLDDFPIEVDVVVEARPLLEMTFSRLMELTSVGCSDSTLLHCLEIATRSTYIAQMESMPPDEEGGERTLRQSLEVHPGHILARGLLGRHLVKSGRADESVAVLLDGFAFVEVPAHVCMLLKPVNQNIRSFGVSRMQTVFREAVRSLERPGMPNHEERDTLKASLESILCTI